MLRSALTAVAVATIAAAMVQRAGSARLREVAAWARVQEAHWLARDFARAPLWGETTAGAAFEHYGAAMAQLQQLGSATSEQLRNLRLRPSMLTSAERAGLLQQVAPALAELQQGAHCRNARTPVVWRQGFANHTQNLLVARDLVNAAVLTGKQQCAAGQDRQAVQLLLDAATFGADLLGSPILIDQMVGAALTVIATAEAWDDASLCRLEPAALQLLADGLQRLDARCPLALDFGGETLLLANTVLHDTQQAGSLSLQAWRYGFSTRWAMADAVMLQAAAKDELAAIAALPWPLREPQMLGICESPQLQQNPMLALVLPNLSAAELSLRQCSTMLRLLRCAVAWRLGDRDLQLADPLGDGPLLVEQQAGAVRFVSSGKRQHKPFERVATVD